MMSSVIIEEFEATLPIKAQRLYKAFLLDTPNLVPKAIPFIKHFECIEGDGGVGSIRLVTYVQGDQVKTLKHKIDEIDEANLVFKYTVFEGEIVGEDIERFVNTVKIKAGGPNEISCVYRYTSEYHIKKNDPPNTQDKIKARRERAKGVIQAVEAYLLANPQEYICLTEEDN